MKIAGIYSESISVDDNRFRLLFSYENIYSIMRFFGNSEQWDAYSIKSSDFEIKNIFNHSSYNVYDVISDIMCMRELGTLELQHNDIVAIRINGLLNAFLYGGVGDDDIFDTERLFKPIDNFFEAEQGLFIKSAHQNNCVIDILNKKLLHIENINPNRMSFFVVVSECFDLFSNQYMFDYSVYLLKSGKIKNICPREQPFNKISICFDFLKEQIAQVRDGYLLYERNELEMIRDYYILRGCAG